MLFKREDKKKQDGNVGGAAGAPTGFAKQGSFLGFKIKSRPVYEERIGSASTYDMKTAERTPPEQRKPGAKKTPLERYINWVLIRKKDLQIALRAADIKKTPYDFVRDMMKYAIIIGIVITIAAAVALYHFGLQGPQLILAPLLGAAMYGVLFGKFVNYPIDRSKQVGKEIEKDILFAARDIVISMRSGMPLFNAMTAACSGYGASSKEFSKVIELIQLGMPIESAMEEISSKSQSKTFKRVMLQASVSIKAGVDVTGALQEVVDEVMQERVIDLRRYGQRLNALAMFYMLFGVIFPSMGIAVATILTTFISIFTINVTVLALVLIGVAILQVIFINIMRSSRPVFAM